MPATAELSSPPPISSLESRLDLAIEHHQAGRLPEAEQLYRDILRQAPHHRDALHLLGAVAHRTGRNDEAIHLVQQAIRIDGSQAVFHNTLGSVYQSLGHLAAAAACYQQSVTLDRNYPEGHNNLGMVLLDLGRQAEAAAVLQRAVELRPDYANAYNNLGIALKLLGRFAEATASFRRGLQSQDGFWEAHFQLGNILKDQGRVEEAIESYERVLEYQPHAVTTHNNLLCTLNYRDGITLEQLAAAHARFDRTFGEPYRSQIRPHENDLDPDRPLRIGFVSPDLHRHPVGFLTVRMFDHLDRSQVEATCYNTSLTSDDITARIKANAASWRDAPGWNDERLTQAIRDDRIDILFDMTGHTRDSRLLVFARKPAPIQISWAGYVGTTGLRTMDYLLADAHEVPPEAEVHYCERVLRMPDGYICYEPAACAPAVSPVPALERGHVTFGSFNNQAKLGRRTVETWSRILHRVPGSRLVLKYYAMSNPAVAGRLREMFAGHGIEPDRIDCLGTTSHAEQLERYRDIDIALDPFPYNGGLTTLEALWMGVPVVSCPGETFAGRHSLSHLSNIGLTTTIARDLDDYVSIAESLAGDLPALARLREGLREQMQSSPLCDGERFARHFEQVMRGVWRDWVAAQAEAEARA
jgi:protein O-GlcNAc transferase